MSKKKNSNMKVWDQVCVTNPDNTKEVKFGARHFTAIDGYSQFQKATEVFGAVGFGWGWESKVIELDPRTITLSVKLWYIHPDTEEASLGDRCYIGEVYGCKSIGEGRTDEDAPKKALTDGITKALSYLGFNADVFMGKFDDSKYVNEARKKFTPSVKPTPKGEVPDISDEMHDAVSRLQISLKELDLVRPPAELVGWANKSFNDVFDWFVATAHERGWNVSNSKIEELNQMVIGKAKEHEQRQLDGSSD
jgi:hypothetical protein